MVFDISKGLGNLVTRVRSEPITPEELTRLVKQSFGRFSWIKDESDGPDIVIKKWGLLAFVLPYPACPGWFRDKNPAQLDVFDNYAGQAEAYAKLFQELTGREASIGSLGRVNEWIYEKKSKFDF